MIALRVGMITIGTVLAVGVFIAANACAMARDKSGMLKNLAFAALYTAFAALGVVGWR